MSMSIKATCRIRWAAHNSGPRSRAQLKWIVLHDTEGGSAASVASQFASQNATASTHLVVDDKECYRMVPDLVIPWGAPGGNTAGLHIEQVGWARWSRATWLAHEKTLRRSAYKAARWRASSNPTAAAAYVAVGDAAGRRAMAMTDWPNGGVTNRSARRVIGATVES